MALSPFLGALQLLNLAGSNLINLIILIKKCKIPHKNKNLDKAILFSRNQVFWPKNRKLERTPTTVNFSVFY